MAAEPTALLSPTTDHLDPEQASVTVSEPSPSPRVATAHDQFESRVFPGGSETRKEPSVPEETILPGYLRQTKSGTFPILDDLAS